MEKPGVGRTTPGYFQFCFYLHLRNWKPMRHTTAVKNESDKELNWTGQRTTRFADGHIFTSSEPDSTKHSPMQNSSLHRTQEAGTGSRGRFPGHPSWHSSLICNSSLTGLFMLRSPSQHPLKHSNALWSLVQSDPQHWRSPTGLPVICTPPRACQLSAGLLFPE